MCFQQQNADLVNSPLFSGIHADPEAALCRAHSPSSSLICSVSGE